VVVVYKNMVGWLGWHAEWLCNITSAQHY